MTIWYLSGPKRYDYSEAADDWLYSRDERTMGELLSEELSQVFKREVNLKLTNVSKMLWHWNPRNFRASNTSIRSEWFASYGQYVMTWMTTWPNGMQIIQFNIQRMRRWYSKCKWARSCPKKGQNKMMDWGHYGWPALCCRRERNADASDLNKRSRDIIQKQRVDLPVCSLVMLIHTCRLFC